MKKFNLFITFLTVLILITGCSSDRGGNLDFQVVFIENGTTISTEGFHTYTVQLTDKNGNRTDAEKVYYYMNMERMNHPIEGTMQQFEAGLYQIELPLAMNGEWYVHISVTRSGEIHVFEEFSITGEGEKQLEYLKGFHADLN